MIDPQKSIYATGRRKHAVARVWIQPGNGKIQINERTWKPTSAAKPHAWCFARRLS